MIKITAYNSFCHEKTYIIDTLFRQFLGVDFHLTYTDERDYCVELNNKNKLIIRDSFFSRFRDGYDYLKIESIPEDVQSFNGSFLPAGDLPIIFGTGELQVSKRKIICGVDIFSSSFFMLTRWEEYVNKKRDTHNRFPACESLAHKGGFIDRPIVNEYTEFLWNMLSYLRIDSRRSERKYRILPTHDIDVPIFWSQHRNLFRVLAGNIIKRKSLSLAFKAVKSYTQTKRDIKNDPNNTFDRIMTLSESYGLQSYFFFMAANRGRYDFGYPITNEFIKMLMKSMTERGHVIGFHPSYETYNNNELWEKEVTLLRESSPQNISCGRQHYLRLEVPLTWRIWEENGMEWSSILGYPEREGFRSGTCYEFHVFDILRRKQMKLQELPLITMEGSLLRYQRKSVVEMLQKVKAFANTIKTYKGNYVFLWHNTSFNRDWNQEYSTAYERFLECLVDS